MFRPNPAFFWKTDPDPTIFQKPSPDPIKNPDPQACVLYSSATDYDDYVQNFTIIFHPKLCIYRGLFSSYYAQKLAGSLSLSL